MVRPTTAALTAGLLTLSLVLGCAGGIGTRPDPDEEIGEIHARRSARRAGPPPVCACAADEICCNSSCGICAKPDEPCAAPACD